MLLYTIDHSHKSLEYNEYNYIIVWGDMIYDMVYMVEFEY